MPRPPQARPEDCDGSGRHRSNSPAQVATLLPLSVAILRQVKWRRQKYGQPRNEASPLSRSMLHCEGIRARRDRSFRDRNSPTDGMIPVAHLFTECSKAATLDSSARKLGRRCIAIDAAKFKGERFWQLPKNPSE